ncbi:MAG: SURF1 family protein [Alteraurantiacibacter sp.]
MILGRIPIIPTIVVVAAAAVMVALGFWQLGRKDEKEAMIAAYQQALATAAPPLSLTQIEQPQDALFRQVTYDCVTPAAWRGIAGRNRDGQAGYAHYFTCTDAENANGAGPFPHDAEVGIGWSRSPQRPKWAGGAVSGLIAPGGEQDYILIADEAQAGLLPLAKPDPADLPNNHLAYAGQWFFFALTALGIYWLALRGRWRDAAAKQR